MTNVIKVAGIDPALSNFGMVRADFDLATGCVRIESVRLVQTVKDGSKQVRKGSDDLRRCREIVEAMRDFLDGVTLGFAEVPSGGAKSANALKALSMATALLGACPVQLIEVSPAEVKMATVGKKTAAKEDMIDWATETHPEAEWITYKRNGEMLLADKNEHIADAICAIYAGLRTQQFKNLTAAMSAIKAVV